MRVLIIGGGGKVGRIINDALEAEHACVFLDRVPVPGRESRTILADVHDDDAVEAAMAGVDAVVYLAMGIRPGEPKSIYEPDLAFGVNTTAFYKVLCVAAKMSVNRVIYASSMSVFGNRGGWAPFVDDNTPATAWDAYGLSKRLGENLCHAAADMRPDAAFLSLRLLWPCEVDEWAKRQASIRAGETEGDGAWQPLSPGDTASLFLAALRADVTGSHTLIATGDVHEKHYHHEGAKMLLGWRPTGDGSLRARSA